MSRPKSIGVFCSASENISPFFHEEMEKLGSELAKNSFSIVYGGAESGSMARLAKGAMKSGGEVIGVFPEEELAFENPKKDISEFISVDSLQERKQLMYEKSDGFIFAPGGLGTLDELFDLLSQQAIHAINDDPKFQLDKKPILLMNSFQYWDPLREALHLMVEQNFIRRPLGQVFHVVEPVEDIIQFFKKI